jgi:CDP-glucose 4,6-dehydratase
VAFWRGTLEAVGLMPDSSFWSGKRVFLTGHTGFKGSWLAIWLQAMDAQVGGFALAPATAPALFEVARVAEGMESQIGDIRNLEDLRASMVAFDPEIVMHVLEVARMLPRVRAIVCVTTDKCYENREWVWGYREDEPMGGHDPYSNSKGCAELVCAAYRSSFFGGSDTPALATARAGNVIGGGDWAEDRLIPDILRAFDAGVPVLVRNPVSTRPWQHVLEPLAGYLDLAEALWTDGHGHAEGWNFGPRDEDARPVQAIVEHMAAMWGAGAGWQLDAGSHPHEARYLKLDISKARAGLGWQPRWMLEDALGRIVAWHKAWRGGGDMRAHCLTDIADYSAASTH